MPEYTACVEREGEMWVVHVPELDAVTQARRLGEVEHMARDLAAIITGRPIESISVRIDK